MFYVYFNYQTYVFIQPQYYQKYGVLFARGTRTRNQHVSASCFISTFYYSQCNNVRNFRLNNECVYQACAQPSSSGFRFQRQQHGPQNCRCTIPESYFTCNYNGDSILHVYFFGRGGLMRTSQGATRHVFKAYGASRNSFLNASCTFQQHNIQYGGTFSSGTLYNLY